MEWKTGNASRRSWVKLLRVPNPPVPTSDPLALLRLVQFKECAKSIWHLSLTNTQTPQLQFEITEPAPTAHAPCLPHPPPHRLLTPLHSGWRIQLIFEDLKFVFSTVVFLQLVCKLFVNILRKVTNSCKNLKKSAPVLFEWLVWMDMMSIKVLFCIRAMLKEIDIYF